MKILAVCIGEVLPTPVPWLPEDSLFAEVSLLHFRILCFSSGAVLRPTGLRAGLQIRWLYLVRPDALILLPQTTVGGLNSLSSSISGLSPVYTPSSWGKTTKVPATREAVTWQLGGLQYTDGRLGMSSKKGCS